MYPENLVIKLLIFAFPILPTSIFLIIFIALLWVIYFQWSKISKEIDDLRETIAVSILTNNEKFIDDSKRLVEKQLQNLISDESRNKAIIQQLKNQLQIKQLEEKLKEAKNMNPDNGALNKIINTLQNQNNEFLVSWQESLKHHLAEEIWLIISRNKRLNVLNEKIGYFEHFPRLGNFPQSSVKETFIVGKSLYIVFIDKKTISKAELYLLNTSWKKIYQLRNDPDKFIFPLFTSKNFSNEESLKIECIPAQLVKNGESWEISKKGELIFHPQL
jgi:hypothetical protein